MNSELSGVMDGWRFDPGADTRTQIAALLESLQAAGLLHASTSAVLLGEQYHLGGTEDTRRMAEMLDLTAADRVLDVACYVGGPARQLAREYGCEVVGVDMMEDYVAIAEKLTELCGLSDKVQFMCCSAEAVPLPDESFTVAWSQCSLPADLSWLGEMSRLLRVGGRLAFTSSIRRGSLDESGPLRPPDWGRPPSLGEMARRVAELGFRVISAEDISEMDLEYGWLPARKKLEDNERHYRDLMGDAWVDQACAELDIEIESWRTGREGDGRIVAVKE